MKSFAIMTPFVLSLLAMIGCKENPGSFRTSTDFLYPSAVGNRWNYNRTISVSNVRPDSLRNSFPDTSIFSSVEVEVAGTVILRDSVKASVFRETIEEGTRTQVSDAYYVNRDSGLYLVALRGPGNVIPKGSPKGRFLFNRIYFNDLREITAYIVQSPPLHFSVLDSLIYETPPLLSLKYPLSMGSEWTFRPPGRPWRIDKRVVKQELLQVPAGVFNCFVIQWLYDLNHDGTWDSNIRFLDYVAEVGLIRRSIQLNDIVIVGSEGPGQIGYIDSKDESNLVRLGY